MLRTYFPLALVANSFSVVADIPHAHTTACNDATHPHSFSVTLTELKARSQERVSAMGVSADTNFVIDLMAFYQPSYAEKMGAQWVHQRIQDMVDNTNLALSNSGIDAEIRLVNAQAITGIPDDMPYLDTVGTVDASGISSARILNPYEGFPENTIYTAFGADLAVYIRDWNEDLQPAEVLGYGELGGELSTVFDGATAGKNNADFVLAHEIGHNFNAGHLTDDGGFTFLPAAHAYECANRVTVMGPAQPNGHRFYSSPDIVVDGEVCGIAGVADNTSVIREYAPLAAERRNAPSTVGTVSFVDSTYTINPGDNTAAILLRRTGDLTVSTSVQVALFDGTAIEGRDFFTSYERIEFLPGEETVTFSVELANEPKGVANLQLRYPYRLDIETASAELVLSENYYPGVFGLSGSSSVMENAGSYNFTIERTGGSDGEYSVRVYTENGTRVAGTHYQALDEVIIFADGETVKQRSVTIIDNTIVDPDGTFYIRLDGMGADTNPDASDLVVTIVNNDVAEQPKPQEPTSSGGSFGAFSIIALLLLGIRRLLPWK
ncbi:Calx-beta domain-containing protein [Alkalimonas sp. MEB108]|uniref:Calx-beta domain-containing protein n=1 Tax=Alkalimonas cellulosilytica TaxID=3058395 RepID=A0ABU7JA43_9GAMM|nr:Calx-beta domain-containing protein [Alkalimonas sp. MEB108]MEE2003381.1 Calx-beta domain-containing protein [Alkalimonas sp. MEB108]